MEINYKQKLINIKAFIFDVDGVLTDGSLLISEKGELLRTMNVKDGFAMKFAIDNGYKIGIISGGTNEAVKKRLNNLGIDEIHLRSHDKIIHFNDIINKYGLSNEEIQDRFGWFIEALSYGTPQHAGFAIGIDRLIAEVYNQNSIRDVIPFPKTQSGLDPLTDAPSYISENILEEYNLKYINKDE